MGEEVREWIALESGVDGNLQRAELGESEEQANEIGMVVEHHRDSHPLADSARGESVCKPVHCCVEFGEREGATAVNEAGPLRVASGTTLQKRPQGQVVRDESHPVRPRIRSSVVLAQRPATPKYALRSEGIIEARLAEQGHFTLRRQTDIEGSNDGI